MCITLFLVYVCGFLYLYLKISDCYGMAIVVLELVKKEGYVLSEQFIAAIEK